MGAGAVQNLAIGLMILTSTLSFSTTALGADAEDQKADRRHVGDRVSPNATADEASEPNAMPIDPAAIPLDRISLKRLTGDGGRVDWSPDGTMIVFDRKGADKLYDIWEMRADGSGTPTCLTCDAGKVGLPKGRQIGRPAFHPSGQWLVMQVERNGHRKDSDHPHPGAGVYNDIWVLHRPTNRACRLTEVSDGRWGRPIGGSLHPVFSHDGTKLFWTDMENGHPGLFGDWRMALATFDTSKMPPRLRGHQYFEPGKEGRWFETHGFGPDDSWVYFSGNFMDTSVLNSDIARMTLATGEYERLTFSAGPKADEPRGYEESAHFTSRFDAFSHLSSEAGRGKEELWLASPDGMTRRQVTHFNEPGSDDYELVDGLWSMPSDNAWNPKPPAGKEQLLLYLQVDFNPFVNASSRNEIFLIEFARK